MKNKWQGFFWCVLVLVAVASGCKKKVAPVSERIAKSWAAEAVKHDNTEVYVKGGANNTFPGYTGFSLTLNTDKTARLVEFDSKTFTGTWELQGDSKLILRNLGPEEPTGTGGTIEYTIRSIEDKKLVLIRTGTSIKTGNTTNEYTLTVP